MLRGISPVLGLDVIDILRLIRQSGRSTRTETYAGTVTPTRRMLMVLVSVLLVRHCVCARRET